MRKKTFQITISACSDIPKDFEKNGYLSFFFSYAIIESMIFNFLEKHWFDLLQSLSIVMGFLFTALALRNDNRSRRVDHLLSINQSYRDVWDKVFSHPELSRIMKADIDLKAEPITELERRLAYKIILHMYVVYEAIRNKQIAPGEMEKDIYDYLQFPIPRAIWEEMKKYQNKEFVRYIENLLKKHRLEAIELI